MNPFDTVTIDYDSEPGAWADALKYSVNIRILDNAKETQYEKPTEANSGN